MMRKLVMLTLLAAAIAAVFAIPAAAKPRGTNGKIVTSVESATAGRSTPSTLMERTNSSSPTTARQGSGHLTAP